MNWFPLLLESENINCLVIGGGRVALHKIKTLMPGQFRIKVVAPEIMPEICSMPVETVQREAAESDLDEIRIAIDATGNPALADWLDDACRKRGIILNVVDDPQRCSFIFPAIMRRGKLMAAVSTSGVSPAAAAWVRDKVDAMLPYCFDEILCQMEKLRPIVREKIPKQEIRAAFLKRCFALAMEKERALSDEEVNELWTESL